MNITLEEVSEHLEGFHKYDGYGMCICPFHDDHSPSCRVSSFGYKCMSCGAKGSLAYLYEKVSGKIVSREKKFNPAQKIWYTWTEKYGSIQAIAKLAHQELKNNPERGHYLKQRQIDSQINPGKLGFLDGYYTFPVRNEYDEIMGLVARASPTIQTSSLRYTVSPHCEHKLYVPNWRKVLKDEYLYLCYGTLDAWTLVMAGYAGVTGISGQELNFHNLDRFRKPMYIIPDKSEEKNALALQCRLDWRGMTLLLDYPEGTKDLNGIQMKYGLEKVNELIEKAKEHYQYE